MSAKNLFVVSLTIDASTEDSFGMKIVKVEGMPANLEFPKKSQMSQYSTINIKSKKAEAAPKATTKKAAPVAAPVTVQNEGTVQALLQQPDLLAALQAMLAGQGSAAVSQQSLPPVAAPSLNAARSRKNAK